MVNTVVKSSEMDEIRGDEASMSEWTYSSYVRRTTRRSQRRS